MRWGCHQHKLGSSLHLRKCVLSQLHRHTLTSCLLVLWLGLEQLILCKTSLGPAAGLQEQPL